LTEIAAPLRLHHLSSNPTHVPPYQAAVGNEGETTSAPARVPSLWQRVAAAVSASHRASVPF
jgi:hypothetical protein